MSSFRGHCPIFRPFWAPFGDFRFPFGNFRFSFSAFGYTFAPHCLFGAILSLCVEVKSIYLLDRVMVCVNGEWCIEKFLNHVINVNETTKALEFSLCFKDRTINYLFILFGFSIFPETDVALYVEWPSFWFSINIS